VSETDLLEMDVLMWVEVMLPLLSEPSLAQNTGSKKVDSNTIQIMLRKSKTSRIVNGEFQKAYSAIVIRLLRPLLGVPMPLEGIYFEQ
jgi:hypothetical protein